MDFKDPKLEFLADMSFGLDMYDVAEINNGYKCAGIQHYLIDKSQRIPKDYHKRTIQRNWQHRLHKTKKNKTKITTHYVLDITVHKQTQTNL